MFLPKAKKSTKMMMIVDYGSFSSSSSIVVSYIDCTVEAVVRSTIRSSVVVEIPHDALCHVKSGLGVAQGHWNGNNTDE